MKKTVYTLTILMLAGLTGLAQILDKEVTFDLTKKEAGGAAFNGYPNDIVIDDANQQFELVFVTKSKPSYVVQNRLIFDYDLNYKETITEEYELVEGGEVPEVVRKTNPNYKGDVIENVNLDLKWTPAGIRMQKKKVSYTYNWDKGDYDYAEEVLEQLKVKELFGKTMYNPYTWHCNDPANGDLIYVSGTIDPKQKFATQGYKIRRVNTDLEVSDVGMIDFKYYQKFFNAGWVTTDTGESFAVLIFANAGGKGVYQPKVNQSPTVNEWTYLAIKADGTVINRATFQTKVNNWYILGTKYKDGSVYIYGPGETKGVGDKHQELMAAIGTGKQDAFQVIKVTGDKVDFVAGPSLDEMNDKASKPASQKKFIEYDGRKIDFREFNFASNGDIFISAQDFSTDVTTTLPLYKDLFMFHFGADGTFKRLYGINSIKKTGVKGIVDRNTDPRFYPEEGVVYQAPSGSMYWMLSGVQQISKYVSKSYSYNTETTTTTWIPRFNCAIAKFDPESGTLDEFQKLGNDDFLLYQLPNTGAVLTPFDGGSKLLFLGYGGEKGRQLWLGKLDPSKQ